MLILTRRIDEQLIIGDYITITVLDVRGGQVKIGIDAPSEINIAREELLSRSDNDRQD